MTRRTLCTTVAVAALMMTVSQVAFAGGGFVHGGGQATNWNAGPGATSPVMNAGLYPMPVQTVPPRIGGTYITNQAFYPHEYLYAHQHHYLAPPFYHVRGKGMFGFLKKHHHDDCDCECCDDPCPRCGSCGCNGNCKLRGTEVIVKYKSKRKWLKTHFLPPR